MAAFIFRQHRQQYRRHRERNAQSTLFRLPSQRLSIATIAPPCN
jgi:hypothetical protein